MNSTFDCDTLARCSASLLEQRLARGSAANEGGLGHLLTLLLAHLLDGDGPLFREAAYRLGKFDHSSDWKVYVYPQPNGELHVAYHVRCASEHYVTGHIS